MSSIEMTFTTVKHEWILRGIRMKEKRLVFKDPNHLLLARQIDRWRRPGEIPKEKQGEERAGLVQGFRLHSLALHVLCTLLQVITFGLICKSMSLVLGNKKIYFNINSYVKWRRLNELSIRALNLNVNHAKLAHACKGEIIKIAQVLATRIDKRRTLPSITTAVDPFVMTAEALKQAKLTIQAHRPPAGIAQAIKDKVQYRLAAFYLLQAGELQRDCEDEFLKISQNVKVRDRDITREEVDRLTQIPHDQLTQDELTKLARFKILYEKSDFGFSYQIPPINTKIDALSSVHHANSPVFAKKLLSDLLRGHHDFYASFIAKILEPLRPQVVSDTLPEAKELFQHICKMGQAFEEQFSSSPPTFAIQKTIKEAFVEFCEKKWISEENQYENDFGLPISMKLAFELLSSAQLVENGESSTLTCPMEDQPDLQVDFKKTQYFEDKETHQAFAPPYLTAFSGELEGEEGLLCTTEAVDFVREFERLTPFMKRLFSKHVAHGVEALVKDQSPPKILPQLQKLYTMLEKVSRLINSRYWAHYGPALVNALTFADGHVDNLGDIKEGHVKRVRRTPEEHAAMMMKYFPGYTIYLPERQESPKIDRTRDDLNHLADPNTLISHLFASVHSNAHGGSCCVGALAQAAIGLYDSRGNNLGDTDMSQQEHVIRQIRIAVANYMTEHPQQFIDLIATNYTDSLEVKLDKVRRQAQAMRGFEWFTNAEITAFSYIIGRPIYINLTGPQKLKRDGSIEMKTIINDHFDAEPIYLLLAGQHYDHLRPKRIGKNPIMD